MSETTNTMEHMARRLFASNAAHEAASAEPNIPWDKLSPSSSKGLTIDDVREALARPADYWAEQANASTPTVAYDRTDPLTWFFPDFNPQAAAHVDKALRTSGDDFEHSKERTDHTILAAIAGYMEHEGAGSDHVTKSDNANKAGSPAKLLTLGEEQSTAWGECMKKVFPRTLGKGASGSATTTMRAYVSHAKAMGKAAVRPFHTVTRIPVCVAWKDGTEEKREIVHADAIVCAISHWKAGATLRSLSETNKQHDCPQSFTATYAGKTVQWLTLPDDVMSRSLVSVAFPALKMVPSGDYDKALSTMEAKRVKKSDNPGDADNDDGTSEAFTGLPESIVTAVRELLDTSRAALAVKGEAREKMHAKVKAAIAQAQADVRAAMEPAARQA